VSLVIVFFTFLRDEWPQRGDLKWLLKAGGVFSKSGQEPPSNRFNAGEKVIFWLGVLVLGVIVVASGLVMDKLIPNLVYDRATMQAAHMVHAVSTVLMMCMFALHIYLGTIGMRGAYTRCAPATWTSTGPANTTSIGTDDIEAGRIPAQRSQPLVTDDDVENVRPA
jgi:formate dehydrogenase subunit gamma